MLKKITSKPICLCLTALMLIQAFFIVPAAVSFAEDGTVTYESDGVTLTGTSDGESVTITGSSCGNHYYEVNIPKEIEGLPVTAIDAGAFQGNCSITSVTIPSGVTSLPLKAFYKCSALKMIDLNMVEDIGDKHSGWATLGDTLSLETIKVSDDNPSFAAVDGVLFTKDMSTLMIYPTAKTGGYYVIPDGVSSLWSRAFSRLPYLTEVTLSAGISEYPDSFYRCEALRVMNLNMLSFVGGSNFKFCTAVEKVTVSDSNQYLTVYDGVLFTKDMTTLLYYPPAREGTEYTIPDGVTSIRDAAFQFSNLKYIHMPGTLMDIGGYAFSYSKNLEELIFPDGLQGIGTNACTGCESLSAVYVPASVTSIVYGALDGPMAGPYAVIYGETLDADGNYTYVYNYVKEHSDEYQFKDIQEEKIPSTLTLTCGDSIELDAENSSYTITADTTGELSFVSSDTGIVTVDAAEGVVHAVSDGEADVTVTAAVDAYHEARGTVHIKVSGIAAGASGVTSTTQEEPTTQEETTTQQGTTSRKKQTISGKTSFTKGYGCKPFSLAQTAKTTLTYKSSNTKIAKVSSKGVVTILRPGKVKIYVKAKVTSKYKAASKTVTITAKLPAPVLTAKRYGRRVKLSWNKVTKASGYQLYIKYPGRLKYKLVLTEPKTTKSVTHRGLTKGKTYRYKLRAYTKIGGKTYYSAFSKVKTITIK